MFHFKVLRLVFFLEKLVIAEIIILKKTQQPATAEELANRRRRKALKMRKWRASMTSEEKTAYRLKDAERKKHPISWRPHSPDREIFIRINDYTGEVDRCDKGRCWFSVSKCMLGRGGM